MSACYLMNRIPTIVLKDLPSFEVLNKTKPHIGHMRVFGCVSYVLIPEEMRNKLDAKALRLCSLDTLLLIKGMCSTSHQPHMTYDPATRRVLVSRDVKFTEGKVYYEEKQWDDLKDLSRTHLIRQQI